MEIVIIFFLISFPLMGFWGYKQLRKNAGSPTTVTEYLIIVSFCISALLFCFGIMLYGAHYKEAIDIVDGGYSPFSSEHSITLITFFLLAIFGIIKLWLKGRSSPPLLFVLSLIFVIIGMIISVAVILQISSNTQFYDSWLFFFLPFTYILTAVILIYKCIGEEAKLAINKHYNNKFLNYLNKKMAIVEQQPFYVVVFLIPVFVTIVAILVLFGQEVNSITKVFTETTTWNFSTKTHPPFLDHKGHYLCTVAVCGDPMIVKPIRLGRRHGFEIVVNRQLLVANAFEELLSDHAPSIHKVIRRFYDRFGYPLSKKINTAQKSNLVYRLMKPMEYFFIFCLYLCSEKPEEKIAKQYTF